MKTYVPELAAAKVHNPRRILKLGTLAHSAVASLGGNAPQKPAVLEDAGRAADWITIIRVPITFPPDKFNGRLLSAMSTPDLRGTQGSFSQFTTRLEQATFESGSRYPLKRTVGGHLEGCLEGPENALVEGGDSMRIPFRIRLQRENAHR